MRTLLSLDSVSCQIGSKELFDKLKLVISDNTRLGIIGPNGSGKSTLMKIMAGLVSPDDGKVVRGNVRVSYVPQMNDFNLDLSVQKIIINRLSDEFSLEESEVRSAKYLSQLGFVNLEQKVSELSGGWRRRLALAMELATEPDLLLLDEPTNHLDLEGLLWLENLLSNSKTSWVIVSHDRYFLEKTANEIIEIAPWYKTGMLKFAGAYNTFIEKRAEFLEQETKNIASLSNKFRTELEWASRAPKARTTKASFRLKEVERLNLELQDKKSRVQGETQKVSFTSSSRQTKDLVEFINVSFNYENKEIVKKFDYTIQTSSCLGILGTNGQGKSTFLKLVGGSLNPTTGKIKRAAFLKIVYFDQLRATLDAANTLRDILADEGDQVVYQGKSVHIISWAKRFRFSPDDLDKKISMLSGGEQARALLSILVRQEADLLILDEPTNDLDISMLEALETMLIEFEGAVILVTHDRFMLEKVCTHFLGFSPEQELLPYASYEQWEVTRKSIPTAKIEKQKQLKKLSDLERKELNQIEKKILKAEQLLSDLEVKASDPDLYSDSESSLKIAAELRDAKEKVDALYHRWSELEQLQK